jgi:hypothetical protein
MRVNWLTSATFIENDASLASSSTLRGKKGGLSGLTRYGFPTSRKSEAIEVLLPLFTFDKNGLMKQRLEDTSHNRISNVSNSFSIVNRIRYNDNGHSTTLIRETCELEKVLIL